jgi:hypothetical protein
MQPIEELINTEDPGWPLVQEWMDEATNLIEVLPCDKAKAKDALYKTQVTTRSLMGAVVYETGGLLIDHGWLRVLGSGHAKLNRSLPEWNKGKSFNKYEEQPAYLLVADDAIGGFFAINGGALGKDAGNLYYLSPDSLEWEATELSYSEFLTFCFNGDLEGFYEGMRWDGWEKEVANLNGNMVYNFFPPLFTEEGKDINQSSRKPISVEEQFRAHLDMRKQLGLLQDGI